MEARSESPNNEAFKIMGLPAGDSDGHDVIKMTADAGHDNLLQRRSIDLGTNATRLSVGPLMGIDYQSGVHVHNLAFDEQPL